MLNTGLSVGTVKFLRSSLISVYLVIVIEVNINTNNPKNKAVNLVLLINNLAFGIKFFNNITIT